MNYYRDWVDKLEQIEKDRPAKEFDDLCRRAGVPTMQEDYDKVVAAFFLKMEKRLMSGKTSTLLDLLDN